MKQIPESTRNLLQLAMESLYLAIIVDKESRVAYLNKSYADILGWDQEKAIGKPVEVVIPGSKLRDVVKTGKPDIGAVFVLKNGQPIVCNRLPLTDDEGQVLGAISTVTFRELDKIELLNREILYLVQENETYKKRIELLKKDGQGSSLIIGNSPHMESLKKTIASVASSMLPVLITGETGTGKEVFANAVQAQSNRADKKFVKINCAAIPKELLESELFGYEYGAFSGAAKGGKMGKFEYANGGTILLDEIGEMPLYLQAKLLRVLQEKELERVGGLKPIPLDIRLIATTNQDIGRLIDEGKFRSDLYYRLNTVEIYIPPLRERLEEIGEFCRWFIPKINEENGCCITDISEGALQLLENYNWPGNVRELRHVLERACVMVHSGVLTEEHLAFVALRTAKKGDMIQIQEIKEYASLKEKKDNLEYNLILQALQETRGNKAAAARSLGMDRSVFYAKIKRYNLNYDKSKK